MTPKTRKPRVRKPQGESGIDVTWFPAYPGRPLFQKLPDELLLMIARDLELECYSPMNWRRHVFSWLCASARRVILPRDWYVLDLTHAPEEEGKALGEYSCVCVVARIY